MNPGHFLAVRESSFESNQSEDDGGAIFAEEGESVTVEDSTFLRNRAPNGNGGAVQLDDNDASLSSSWTAPPFPLGARLRRNVLSSTVTDSPSSANIAPPSSSD